MSQEQQEAPPSAETNVGTPIPGEAPPGQEQGVAPAYQAPVNPDVENQARRWGWVPKEQWRGKPETWVDASEFVDRGRNVVPIARDMVQKSEARVRQLEQTLGETQAQFTDRIRRLEGMTQVALNKQREQLYAQFEAAKDQAVEQGDTARYRQLSQQQAQALQQFQPEAEIERTIRENPTPPPRQQAPALEPAIANVVNEWVSQRPWFDMPDIRPGDKAMTQAAVAIHTDLLQSRPGMSISENLAEVENRMRAAFPHKFGPAPVAATTNGQTPPAQYQQAHAPSVEGGTRQPGGGQRAKGWNDLPQEAKASADKFINGDGLFLPPGVNAETATDKDKQAARSAYAKSYWEQE